MTFSYDRNKSLGHLAGIANRLLSNTLALRFSDAGINMTSEQWGAVIIIINSGAITQAKIGELQHLERSSVSRLLDGLERRGWIERKKDPKDSRQKIVSPTPEVIAIAERCADIAKNVLEEAQQGMSEDERLVCRSFLTRIIGNLSK